MGHRSRSRIAVAAVALLVALDLGLVGLTLHAVASSPRLDLEVRYSPEPGCPWVVEPPEGAAGPLCVEAIAGVELAEASLVRDPSYLEGRAAFRRWLADQGALVSALEGRRSVELAVRDEQGGRTVVAARLRRASAAEVAVAVGPVALVLLAFVGIAAFLVLARPGERPARLVMVMAQGALGCGLPTVVAGARGLAIDPALGRLFFLVNLAAFLGGAAAVWAFGAVFPRRRLGRLTTPVGIALPTVVAVATVAADLLWTFGAFLLVATAMMLVGLALIGASQVSPGGQLERLQARWVLWGILVPFSLWLVLRLPFLLGVSGGHDASDTIIVLSYVTVPIGIAVAVLRHRLLDIDVVVRRTALAGAAVALVLLLYAGLVTILSEEGAAALGGLGPVLATAVVVAAVTLAAEPWLGARVGRLLFRRPAGRAAAVPRLADRLAGASSPDEAARLALSALVDELGCGRAAVLLDGGEAGRAWVRPAPGVGGGPELPAASEPVWQVARALEGPRLGEADPMRRDRLDGWLALSGLELALPLRAGGELRGLLALAAPGRRLLASEDVALVRTAAASLALALARTLAEEKLRDENLRLEERVAERTAELERARLETFRWEKMAALGVMAAGVSHELNTPLGVALSAADQLAARLPGEAGEPGGREARLVRLCHEGTRRAAEIIRGLQSFAKADAAERAPTDLNGVVETALRLLGSMLRGRGVSLEVTKGEVPLVDGSSALLGQVVTNLVVNAALSRVSGVRVRVRTERRGDRVALVVEDDGPGVPPELRERIFEPFFTTREPGKGTGLGLALCYAFVEHHEGRIWVEGEPGEGARFVVELPPSAVERRPTGTES